MRYMWRALKKPTDNQLSVTHETKKASCCSNGNESLHRRGVTPLLHAIECVWPKRCREHFARMCPFPLGDQDPHVVSLHGSLVYMSPYSRSAHLRFSHFCRSYGHDKNTDRSRYSVCSNSPHPSLCADDAT